MTQYENMSAVHAGTKKWNKIIRGHQNEKRHDSTKTTASSNENLMKVFYVWCEEIKFLPMHSRLFPPKKKTKQYKTILLFVFPSFVL